jgi:hypothetical protein
VAAQRHVKVAGGWLGAGAVTVGIGAALAAGAGVAHADSAAPSNPGKSASSARSAATADHHRPGASPAKASVRRSPAATTITLRSWASTTTRTPKAQPATYAKSATSATAVVLPAATTPVAPPLPSNPVDALVREAVSAMNGLICPNPLAPPTDPLSVLVIQVVGRVEVELGLPVVGTPIVSTPDPVIGTNPVSTAPGEPSPDDVVQTPYGSIGKWLLEPGGDVSNFGGGQINGKNLVEPINLIILDPTSATAAESAAKLDADMTSAGFPVQWAHTTGYQAIVGDGTYTQRPNGFLEGYSDNFFLLPDDHARAFGPAPVADGTGYVWSVAASREQAGLLGLLPTHTYVSFNEGRDALAAQLLLGGATLVGIIALGNAYDGSSGVTGDHDGYAIVIQLN